MNKLCKQLLDGMEQGTVKWDLNHTNLDGRKIEFRRAHGAWVLEVDGGCGDDRIYLGSADADELWDAINAARALDAAPDAGEGGE